MSVLIIFIQKAIVQGICILYGTLGEIMTEKIRQPEPGYPGNYVYGRHFRPDGLLSFMRKIIRIQRLLSVCCSRLSVPLPARRWAA